MNIAGYNFDGPYDPDKGFTKDFAAVYSIVDDKPKVVDVGQTNNINDRFPNHERKPCWLRNKDGEIHLYIYKEESEKNRLRIESEIRGVYNPPCGER